MEPHPTVAEISPEVYYVIKSDGELSLSTSSAVALKVALAGVA